MSVTDFIRIRCLQRIRVRVILAVPDVLIDLRGTGRSVSFMLPMSRVDAGRFGGPYLRERRTGERIVLAAEDASGTIVGTVQVILAQPENQPHRADIAKMLVLGALAVAHRRSIACRR